MFVYTINPELLKSIKLLHSSQTAMIRKNCMRISLSWLVGYKIPSTDVNVLLMKSEYFPDLQFTHATFWVYTTVLCILSTLGI